jgi:hypothetical protein
MDFISHGLWGGIASGRKNKRDFWKSFAWGAMPDIIPFGPFFIVQIYNLLIHSGGFVFGKPDGNIIPHYVFQLYSVTHSYFTFLFVFLILWAIYKKPNWLMIGWPIHITMDIFTHSKAFFPTPFLWPLSNYRYDGIPWSHWYILLPNVFILACLYLYFFIIKPRTRKRIDFKNQI